MSIIALASAAIGFASSALPPLVRYLEKRQDHKHALAIAKLQMEASEKGFDTEVIVANIKALVEEGKSLRQHDSVISTNEYVNIFRASVRPTLTYAFFILFFLIKMTALYIAFLSAGEITSIDAGLELARSMLTIVWDDYTSAIFSAIVSFWFGTRSFQYFAEKTTVFDDGTTVIKKD
jgi:hypothetical protein